MAAPILDDLDPPPWGSPPQGATALIQRCHELRRRRVDLLTTEDLRLLIGQQIALPHLVPVAVQRLEENPLAHSDHYPGDLLYAVLTVGASFWRMHPDLWLRVQDVVEDVTAAAAHVAEPAEAFRRVFS